MNNDTWGRVKEQLLHSIGKDAFKNWIEPLELEDVLNGVAQFAVPTTFFGNWVSRNYGDQILSGLTGAGAPID
ncbi:MAG TPA: chromosomal replication initiator protein DnaA, partial [Rhodobacteraceae bacterium]|nr:chromosomal replication initiator protein DnaA [Paracoccaceae bacterium]